ncbi:sodium- and chloride-dependent neutral and basic amino acid transporter B(0+)-like [Hemiscyllium ocellatum]|uniref:sodium- and chloride-dependent neutral and basic amino acid transporter B(0+)-like n=1 Tax=Hemiscyllium ocellatum TaxID=170820 RepID=UPI002965E1A5|nr:sodium- and chloride-dependent neutral and basic amino acid transporter B(0+)-like [Hemiscyllium ocellatum]
MIGNVWRFPYLAYKNGGGAFLIPYSVMLALVGIPLFFLECSFGQFASLGPVAVWRAVPMLQGVGIAMMLLITMSNISYNCIVGYSLYYLFASFQSPLPWADCFSWWGADETCSRTPKETLCNLTLTDGYFEIVNITQLQENNGSCPNGSEISNPHQGPSEQYWDKAVLRRSSSMDETGEVIWYLALCLLLAWLIVGAALSKGIKSSGKVVYFTATFPYVVLTILLIRGVTLEGASKGIEFYIGSQSDFSRLADAEVWKDAATQIFFSISVGWGTLVALSSYNKFHNNCYRDTIIVCVVNCATSVFAGFVIFSILGHMAHIQDKPVSEVAQSGFGLVFIAYPEALAQLPWAPLWSVSFFFMLLTLGVDTQFAGLETVMTALQDQFPTLVQSKRLLLTAGVCSLFYLLGLLCVTQAGIYWLNLMDHYVTDWILVITALLQLIGLSWIYGTNRFIKDIEMMIGERTWLFWLWWRMCWILISPCFLVAVLIWSLTTFAPLRYGSVEYPVWSGALGWCMTIFCIMWIPIMAVVRVVQAEGPTLWQKIFAACTSAPDWGPYLEQHRGERYRKKPDSTEDPNCVHLLVIPENNQGPADGAAANTNQPSSPLKVTVKIIKDPLLDYGFMVSEDSPGPKSSFITEEKRARLKSNPVKVHFAEEVIVNGQIQGNSLLLMPGILKVYLENGQTKAFQFEKNTTVKDIILSLKSKLSIRCIEHFALVLKERYTINKIYILHDDELIEQVVQKREPRDYRCLFRVCFLPRDPLVLLQDDPVTFEYLYSQSCNDVLLERFAMEMKYSTAIRLAALQIQECILSSNHSEKVSMKYIE